MEDNPDIAQLGALIGDPARANILIALMNGEALTATELACEAEVTLQTASSHLKKLEEAGLLLQRKQGRHRYFALADAEVAGVLESLMGLAAKRGLMRVRTGPKDQALRKARVCYNHLAGESGVRLFDDMMAAKYLRQCNGKKDEIELTAKGSAFFEEFGIDLDALAQGRRPLCKPCLDWSSRRMHLAGALGSALLERFYELKWAKRQPDTRAILITPTGEKKLLQVFKR